MELSALKFVVDTSALEQAANKIAELGVAVTKLTKPMQDLTKESAKVDKEFQKNEQAAAKAAIAQEKLKQAQEKTTEATAKSASVLERQNLILEYMAQGNSKGQASILATAKAAGALDDDMLALNNTLRTQRALIGGDPFDKSIGLMQKLSNEYSTNNEVSNLFNKNLGLSQKQMTDLAREKERLITLYSIEGKDIRGLTSEYDQLIQKSVSINQSNDARTNSMRAQIKAQEDAAKATAYLSSELDRVNRLTDSGGNITVAANNKLIKFEQALKLSGDTAAVQTTKLEAYKQKLLAVQKAGGDRNIDYLSRALGPQITDVFVGLFSGQSPLTVLVQQGGQLRDQFALAGVAGADMGKMLTKSASTMISSVKDVGVAIGQVFVNAVVGSGKAAVDFAMKITGTSQALEYMRYQLALLEGSNGSMMKAFNMLGTVLTGVVGVAVFAAIGGLIALAFAFADVIKEENALNRALNLTGAAMGLTLDTAYESSRAMNEFGISTGFALEVLTEMAKAGGMSSESLKQVATTAKAMKTAFGTSVEDVVKQFKELQEKPVESLTKLAIGLGTIPVEILKQVAAYERAGKSIEAAKLATESYEKAGKLAAERTIENFGTITRLGISLKKIWDATWESIMGFGRKDTNDDMLAKLEVNLAQARATVSQRPNSIPAQKERDAAVDAVVALRNKIAATKKLALEEQKNAADAKKFQKTLNEQGSADFKVPEDSYLKKLKEDYKEATKEVDSESKKLLAQNKSSYDLGLIETGAFLSEEIRLIQSQNKQKTDLNKSYITSLDSALVSQIAAIDKMAAKESGKTKTSSDATKVEEKRVESIKSVRDAYDLLTQSVKSNSEVLADSSVEQQYRALAILGQETKKLIEGSKEFARTQDDLIAKRVLATELDQKTAGLFGAELERVKAQIAMQQSHIDKLSDLEKMATNAKTALKLLSESGMQVASPEYKSANDSVAKAQEALDAAKLKSKEAVEKAGFDAVAKYQDMATQRLNAYGDAFQKMFEGMGNAIVDFAKTGKLNFGGLVNSMIEDLIRFEAKKQMLALYESTGGAKGIATFAASLFAKDGASFGSSGIQEFAKGGSFSNSIVDSPTLFKFAKGTGMMGEAGPEAIMPLRRGADGSLGVVAGGSGSAGSVSVNVINNSTSQATTTETTDSKGNRKVEVVIGDMTAGEISRSGSASQKSIKSTFGLQTQLIRR